MSGSEDMSDHLNNFFSHADKLKEMDIVVADDLLSVLLLHGIPNTYENFKCAIELRDQLPTPDALKIKLLEEANSRHNSNAVYDHQEALQVEDLNKHTRAHQCLKKKRNNHKAELAQVPGISKTEQCLRASNIHYEDNQDSIITVYYHVSLNINREPLMKWCIDSDATSHICCDISRFETIQPIKNQKSKREINEWQKPAEIKGTAVLFNCIKNKLWKFQLENTLHVPVSKANLILVTKVAPTEKRNISEDLTGYVNSDWRGDINDRKSRTGFVFKLSNGVISWESRKQESVATSNTEAKYMALTESTR
ncbi:uncharacterized protein LOC110119240 isoform X2 [Bombus terrestris]|uniref:Uncharacterized protein LOC110119240 isoform X2 n=1 Tax=Bombus terrestris TaxID=30195 RepID=A0A9C6SF91_BOMTE|nr:uncharacterized protein LOC110119240 isoform X2 [Bombus terrestris]